MRPLFIFLAALIIVFNLKANTSPPHSLSGYWFSHSTSYSIKIKEKRDKLIIHGLEKNGRPSMFFQVDFDTYVGENGDRIKLDCHDVIFYFPCHNRHIKRIIFEKSDYNLNKYRKKKPHHRERYSTIDDDDYGVKNNYREENHDYDPDVINTNDWPNYNEKINGTWQVVNDNLYVAIIDTRDGLKAKFSGTSTWVSYVQSENDSYVFIDGKGNKYVFDGNKNAQWLPSNKTSKIVKLVKISDQVNY